MEEFPSGQRGQTVNLLRFASVVRIHPPPPARRKRHIACDEFFHFTAKTHRALILLLLASKSDPLTLGSGLGPPLRGGLSAHKEISILTVPSKSEQVIHRLLRFIFVSQSALALRRLRSRPRGRSGEGDAAESREGAGVGPPPTRRKRMPLAALFLLLRKTCRIHPAVPGLELVFGHGAAHEIEHMF